MLPLRRSTADQSLARGKSRSQNVRMQRSFSPAFEKCSATGQRQHRRRRLAGDAIEARQYPERLPRLDVPVARMSGGQRPGCYAHLTLPTIDAV